MIRIVNIYDQRMRVPGDRPPRRMSWQRIIKQGGGSTVLAGDFDAHSQTWDTRFTERRDTAYWEDIIHEHGLLIGNDDRPSHHCTRNECEGWSIIDPTSADRKFGKWTILDGSHIIGSDH